MFAVAAILWPLLVSAEVSDKMPSITANLARDGFVAGIVGMLAWYRWWLGIVGVLVGLLFLSGIVSLWLEEPMRTALINEQGIAYFAALGIGALLVFVSTAVGAFLARQRMKNA